MAMLDVGNGGLDVLVGRGVGIGCGFESTRLKITSCFSVRAICREQH
jgi:hypothetical protein